VPLTQRVMEIELALQRMREGRFDRMGDYFIRVNLPSFRFKVFEHGKVIKEHKIIVGTNRLDDDKVKLIQGHINRTKLFGTRLYQVIVNPTWILPKRVEEGELQTSLDKDEKYLEKQNIKKVKLGSGTEVFIQGSGKGNVLGKVKFLLEETNAIYLHDTDKRHLFNKWRRDFSHGCMRVHEAVEFAEWLLLRDGWSQEEIDRSMRAKNLQRGFDLKNPVNTVTEYITVDLHEDGGPVFYDDIYDYDEDYWKGELPPRETTRWGSSILRPRWVPVVDSATVEGWRKAGKAAPRNLGPDGKPKPQSKKAPDGDIDEGP
jgi:murein L,D-transpeptidase YcbB/YkuD